MRVDAGVAVSREVFSCRDHAVILQSVNERNAHPGRQLWILAIGSRVDDRVRRVVVDVQNRCVCDVYPQCATFLRGQTSLFVSERRIASRAKAHLWRKNQSAAEVDGVGHEIATASTESGACLEVRTNKERDLTHRLQRVELGRELDWRSYRDREPTNFLLLNVLCEPSPLRRIARYVIAKHTWPYQLRYFFAQGHRAHDRIGPRWRCCFCAGSVAGA